MTFTKFPRFKYLYYTFLVKNQRKVDVCKGKNGRKRKGNEEL